MRFPLSFPPERDRFPLFPVLSECVADIELANAIEARATLMHVAPKRILFRQGQQPDKLYLLKAGEVILTSRLADKSVTGFRAAPGSLLGLPAISGGQPYTMTATVTKNSDLHAVSSGIFREIIGSNPRLSLKVLQILAAEVRSARLLISTAGPSTVSR